MDFSMIASSRMAAFAIFGVISLRGRRSHEPKHGPEDRR
jgi:hypothetical protein